MSKSGLSLQTPNTGENRPTNYALLIVYQQASEQDNGAMSRWC